MIAALLAATAAFAPSPLRPLGVAAARVAMPCTMSLDATTILADASQGINGAFKESVANALGPELAEQAPIIGALIFVAIAAFDLGVFKSKDEPAPAPPAEPEPPTGDA